MRQVLWLSLLPVLLFGSCASSARVPEPSGAPYHTQPIIEEGGRTLLWAGDDDWFDVTDSAINPAHFQYGIGRDRIPSIDKPIFVSAYDPRLETAKITLDTMVLGVFQEGEGKAYPVFLMDGHEVVNDTFAGEPYAVLW